MHQVDLNLQDTATYSLHLGKLPKYKINHTLIVSEFEREFDYHPLMTCIGIDANNPSSIYSIIIDYQQIWIRDCNNFGDKTYTTYYFSELTSLKIERGNFRILIKITPFTRLLFSIGERTMDFYMVGTTKPRHRQIKQEFERVFQKYTASRHDTISSNTLVFWDYDNVQLTSNTSFDQDQVSQQLYKTIKRYQPVDEFLCLSANPVTDEELRKIRKIASKSQIRRELSGKDSVDAKLNEAILESFDKKPTNVIIISGDQYYWETVAKLLGMGVTVLLVGNPRAIHNGFRDLLGTDNIVELDRSDNGVASDPDICDICSLEVEKMESHKKFHDSSTCHVCGAEKQGVYAHMKAKHPQYVCTSCETIFVSLDLQNLHIEKHHGALYCMICSRLFDQPHSRNQHMAAKHTKIYCQPCDRAFQSPNGLRSHIENSSKHK